MILLTIRFKGIKKPLVRAVLLAEEEVFEPILKPHCLQAFPVSKINMYPNLYLHISQIVRRKNLRGFENFRANPKQNLMRISKYDTSNLGNDMLT